MNIYLVGYRGTGKTSIAPALQAILGPRWNWVDMDPEIESEADRSIADIFSAEGEAGFREREGRLFDRLASMSHRIIATGGGIVERESNRDRLQEGYAVWLTATPETIWRRILADASTDSRRPNLTPQGGKEEIEQMLARREPLYRSVARLELPTERAAPEVLAQSIADHWADWITGRDA